MNQRKMLVVGIISIAILMMAVFGGVWSRSYAQITLPTDETPGPKTPRPPDKETPTPKDHGGQLPGVDCVYGQVAPDNELDLVVKRFPRSASPLQWGGVINPSGSACQEATELFCVVPVRYLPKRGQLNYFRQAAEIRQYVKGKLDPAESCAPKDVYFDLSGYERYMYDNYKERFGLYLYNPDNRTWEACPDVTFDETLGNHGRLTCSTTKWGFFALGWPPKD